MKAPQDIIIKPIVTEKSMGGIGEKKYTFVVDKKANKIEIAKAVEALFKVNVESVNTANYHGKLKRQGNSKGYRPDWKKAVVTLKVGSSGIEFFDSMN